MDNLLESKRLRNLSKNKKIVDIGIKLKSGEVVPAGAKKIWPVSKSRDVLSSVLSSNR